MSNSFSKFITFALKYPKNLFFGTVALCVGSFVNLYIPLVIKNLVSDISADSAKISYATFILLTLLLAFQGLSLYFRIKNFNTIGYRVAETLRSKIYDNLLKKPIHFFDITGAKELSNRLINDIQVVQSAVGTQISVVIRYSLQVIGGLILMFFVSIKLSLVTLTIIPPIVLISIFMIKRLKLLTKQHQENLSMAAKIVDESFLGIRIVKAFSAESKFTHDFRSKLNKLLEVGLSRTEVTSRFQALVTSVLNFSLLCLLVYSISSIDSTGLKAQDIITFTLYGVIVAVSFSFLSSSFTDLAQATAALERVQDFLEVSLREQSDRAHSSISNFSDLELLDIVFNFPSRPEVKVLNKVGIKVEKGRTVAIVGPSGAGKSALVQILMGFYEPKEGLVKLNGKDYNYSEIKDFLKQEIGYVPQDPTLFGISINDNLRLGRDDITPQKVEEACRQVNIWSFIESLPNKGDTNLGELGLQISGGQRQRLAIARALLRKPKLLVLDEATSALDSENEKLILSNLREYDKDLGVVIISHRFSNIKDADYIYVLNEGLLIEEGDFATLSSEKGLFSHLQTFQV
jgi:ABC-type multidrug transport system fused ATPase/permease subunit